MTYNFHSVDNLLDSYEVELIDFLYDYDLLTKFGTDAKKVFMYFFIKKIDEVLSKSDVLIYHTNSLNSEHELLKHFPKEKVDTFLNKICVKLKSTTNRLFFIKDNIDVPTTSSFYNLDGSVMDEIILLSSSQPGNLQKLKDFLSDNNLKDMFENISKKAK